MQPSHPSSGGHVPLAAVEAAERPLDLERAPGRSVVGVTPPTATPTLPAPAVAPAEEVVDVEATFTIAEVVERTGLTHDTLRYYEKEGLVIPPRDDAGRRRYREHDVRRVTFLTCMRRSEMPIRDLKRYVALVEEGTSTEPERLAIMEAHREGVLARRAELDSALDVIEFKIAAYGGACGS